MENKKYPIPLLRGEIYNVLVYTSEEAGRKYIISLKHPDGQGYSLNLWHKDYEHWLSKFIDAQQNLSEELYQMTLSNWDKIMKHINECIEWLNDFKELPKYPLESGVTIVNHTIFSGKLDKVKCHLIMLFEGYYYVLYRYSDYFKEENLGSVGYN